MAGSAISRNAEEYIVVKEWLSDKAYPQIIRQPFYKLPVPRLD